MVIVFDGSLSVCLTEFAETLAKQFAKQVE